MKMKRKKNVNSIWRQPLAIVGVVTIALWIFAAIFAPWIAPYDPLAQDAEKFATPGSLHLMGTDELNRDIWSRVIYGARISLPYSILLVVLSALLGSIIGGISGYFGGRVDAVVMRLTDMFFAFPAIVLAMAVAAALGPEIRNAVIAITIVSWPVYARLVRGLILNAKQNDYVTASSLLGSSSIRTLVVDLRPNLAGPVFVLAALEVGNALLLLSGLSFLGLGAQPPAAEWGSMVSMGAVNFDKWWVGLFPGLAILSAVLAFNFIGDALRDALDPRTAKALRD
ncbi:MAG: ABC transporter permease [Candidatus Nanopelagicaceae bacterium]|jgi:peptide/nickel transport system permease protein